MEIQFITSVGTKPEFLCFGDKHKPLLLCSDAKTEAYCDTDVQTTQWSRWLIDIISNERPRTCSNKMGSAETLWKINGSPNYGELLCFNATALSKCNVELK